MTPEIARVPGYGPEWNKTLQETGWWHSFELPNGFVAKGVCSLEGLKNRIGQFPIPEDLRGKRVLDIGAWDGWFTFEMERRGAEVLAIDCWDNPRFRQIHQMLGSKAEYRQMDVLEISPETVGRFDVVLFMGVLYHLKHPLLALEKVCAVTKGLVAVDSYVLAGDFDPNSRPVMEFYETDEFEGQTDNWIAPNVACLMAWCRTAGFARVELRKILTYSACLACHRQWSEEIDAAQPIAELQKAMHNSNGGINFDTRKDEYVTAYFRANAAGLKIGDVQPQVGRFGVRPISVADLGGDAWQTNFKLPPGLESGWHEVSLRLRGGAASNSVRIAVDMPVERAAPVIRGASDGTTWKPGQLDLAAGDILAVWAEGLPENADVHNLKLLMNGVPNEVVFVEEANGDAARQVNVRVPKDLPTHAAEIALHLTGQEPGPANRIDLLNGVAGL